QRRGIAGEMTTAYTRIGAPTTARARRAIRPGGALSESAGLQAFTAALPAPRSLQRGARPDHPHARRADPPCRAARRAIETRLPSPRARPTPAPAGARRPRGRGLAGGPAERVRRPRAAVA